jgi:hypothetical protein
VGTHSTAQALNVVMPAIAAGREISQDVVPRSAQGHLAERLLMAMEAAPRRGEEGAGTCRPAGGARRAGRSPICVDWSDGDPIAEL